MKAENSKALCAEELRRRAERQVKTDLTQGTEPFSPEMTTRLLHELRVHQVELEIQNEELRRVEGELNAQLLRYFDLYNLAPIGYLTLNEKGVIMEANLTAAHLLGVARGTLVKQPLSRFILPDDQDIYTSHSHQLTVTRLPQAWDMRMLNAADGSSFWANLQAQPAENGEYRITLSDITERKQAEEEKAKLQAQLSQAQKMEAIGALAGGIAHDFNNILTVIMGNTEMARADAPPGSGFAQELDIVLTSAHRAADLVKQILTYSRQAVADRMPVKIQPLVKESLKMLRSSIPSTIFFTEDIDPQCGAILAEPTQVLQVVMNLCTNAFHAMESSGGGVLAVGLKGVHVDAAAPLAGGQILPGDYAVLTVSDTGTGIETDIIEKIFDPYFTTKGAGKGTGMGLAIAHGIITSYGGAIMVESTVGQGTTFHVYFPEIQELVKEEKEIEEPPRGKERILFVDDEALIAGMGKEILERLGYSVAAHNSSIEALAAFKDDPASFDLVITDLTMPGLTGLELAQQMLSIRPDLPIILCTGFSQLVDEKYAKDIGIKEFALKPLTTGLIGQLVRKVLG